jgi:murein DD-endopeptidase MepM/ murein hydrolase activator NlpD
MWSTRALLTFYSALTALIAAIVVLFPRRPAGGAAPRPPRSTLVTASRVERPPEGRLGMPIAGLARSELRDSFTERRAGHRHEAIDILEPRGTPVVAVDDGTIRKIFESVPGGHTVYQFNRSETFCYYYAHLDRYAPELHEGQVVRRGDRIGFVGTSGNAPPNAPHLHFAVSRLGSDKHWWQGTPIDPYPLLVNGR